MERIWAGILVLSTIPIIWWLMSLGWRQRKKRQSYFLPPHSIPKDISLDREYECVYVSTTYGYSFLERINIYTLGVKSRLKLQVSELGVVFFREGNSYSFFISNEDIDSVRYSSGAIGKFVEKDGLIAIRWFLGVEGGNVSGSELVETSFRPRFKEDRQKILSDLNAIKHVENSRFR